MLDESYTWSMLNLKAANANIGQAKSLRACSGMDNSVYGVLTLNFVYINTYFYLFIYKFITYMWAVKAYGMLPTKAGVDSRAAQLIGFPSIPTTSWSNCNSAVTKSPQL